MASIQGIYLALFGRPADPAGLSFFNNITNNGANLAGISNLSGQAEYVSRFTGMDNTQIVTTIYQSLFGRAPEQAGLDFFVGQLASGKVSINQIAINILDGAAGNDKLVVEAKIAAANLFTSHLDLASEVAAYNGNTAAELVRTYISTINLTKAGTGPDVDAVIQALLASGGQAPDTGTGNQGNEQPATLDFHAVLTERVVTFTGSATGDITEGEPGVFSRGGLTAPETYDYVKKLVLAPSAGQNLVLTAEQASSQSVEGEGTVEITEIGSAAFFLEHIKAKGTAYLEKTATLHESTVLSSSVAVDVAKEQTLTLTTEQANNITIQGDGNTEIRAWIPRKESEVAFAVEKAAAPASNSSDDTFKVLTAGKNVIETGAGVDTVVAGDGDDTIYAQDGWVQGHNGEKYIIGDLGGYSGKVGYFISGGGRYNAVTLAFENSDATEATAETMFARAFSENETLRENFSIELFTDGSGQHIKISPYDSTDNLANIKIEPVFYDSDTFTFVPDDSTFSIFTFSSSDLIASGDPVIVVSSAGRSITAQDVADSINRSPLILDVTAYAEQDTIKLAWKTPGPKADISFSFNNSPEIILKPAVQQDVSFDNYKVDTFTGGDGNDVFVFNGSTLKATDVIKDLNFDTDKIKFEGSGPAIDLWLVAGKASSLEEKVNYVLQSINSHGVAVFEYESKQYALLNHDGDGVFNEGGDQLIDITGYKGTLVNIFEYTDPLALN